MSKPVIIMIPGVGDRSRAYGVFAVAWRLLGYEVHIVAFGWVDTASPLPPKTAAFLQQLDALGKGREVYLIGISAGGTAAVSMLAARPRAVRKVITVCSPLNRLMDLHNPLLAESIEQTRADLARLTAAQRQRILSVYGRYDQVVDTTLSQPEGVRRLRLWSFWHAPTIFVALIFCAGKLHAFLKKAM